MMDVLTDARLADGDGLPHLQADVAGIRPTDKSLSVLVVDDTPAILGLVDAILERRGHHRTLVGNGQQAVDQCRTSVYDVVLMDVEMPVMDGFTATAEIRSLENGAILPIIAMTALTSGCDRERCRQAGMIGYVSKPIDVGDLLRVLERMATGAERMDPA